MISVYIREDYKSHENNSREFAKRCIREYSGIADFTEFSFAENEFGKPFIANIDSDIHFSLSHSGNILVCAVARFNIGVDCQIVNIKDAARCKKIAERFYSPQEKLFLDGLPDADYISNFFKIWTKKEAYIKYTGRGLSQGLSTFSVISPESERGDDVRFKRVAPELPNMFIYLCCEENLGLF